MRMLYTGRRKAALDRDFTVHPKRIFPPDSRQDVRPAG